MAAVVTLADLRPQSLVAPPGHQAVCDELLHSLLTAGHALIELEDAPGAVGAAAAELGAFWAAPQPQRSALQPLQPHEGVGWSELEGGRELLAHAVGPWLRDDEPLPALAAVRWPGRLGEGAEQLDSIARAALSALLRGGLLRLQGCALASALDDRPLARNAWAASRLHALWYRADGTGAGCEAHVDRHILTLIYAPGEAGLQVQAAGGAWHDVVLGASQLLPGH